MIPKRYGEIANRLIGEYKHAATTVDEERVHLRSRKQKLAEARRAQEILQAVAQTVQQEAHRRIAGIVSRCLRAVFDEPYEFRIEFDRKRGRTEARLEFVRDGFAVDPLQAAGGGVVDVASFALRVAALMLSTPPLRRLLVLDEPLKMLSVEYRGRVCEMLEMLARDMGIQIIQVTHSEELKTGTIVKI